MAACHADFNRGSLIKNKLFVPICGIVWALMVAGGLGAMTLYQGTPGVAATTASQWPAHSRIQPASDRATLVLLAHPQCPCTRASISELNELLGECQVKPQVYVLFMKPKGTAKDWEKTDLWRSAAAIPGVQAVTDEGGVEARRFHVSTSGQTLLFNQSGQLVFSGGITAGRGHAGDNAGRDAIVSWINTGKATRHKTFVFGCSLVSSSQVTPDAAEKGN